MKPLYHLIIILLLWLVLSLCTCHPVLGGHHRSNISQCIDSERDALLHFKHGITNDTCGMLTSWASHTDCCRWHGVICSNLTSHVVKLGLAGSDDGSCQLEGKVSPSLGELKHLEHLNLSHNNFNREIPHQLGNLSRLTTLDLGNYTSNYYITVQSLSWISRLTLLRYLDLSVANFSEVRNWIAIVNNLPSLRVLSMDYCELSIETPSSISYVNSSVTLQSISLSGNNFNVVSIFRWLFNLPKITSQLVHLDLSFNYFEGPIPSEAGNLDEIGNLHSVSYLDLSFNSLEGSIPSKIGDLHFLSYLDLSINDFHGVIPSEIGNLHSLSYLDLSSNWLEGSIPSNIGDLHSLSHLGLSNNDFHGVIPSKIGNLHSLSHLDLSSNNFDGLIPSKIGNLHSLSYLDLSYNAIQGSVLKIISKLCNLEQLQLRNNNFTDELSNIHSLVNCNNKALLVLDLSFNSFWGGIPNNIGSLSSLRELNLRSNQLKGEISQGIRQLTKLEKLDGSSNSLEGTLTLTFFSRLVNLRQLSLSDNLGLVISIEEDWVPPFKLDVIQLRSCILGPRFPKWLQSQTNVSQYIDVSNTSIYDSVPVSFWNSLPSYLMYLNMSYNQLYGMLPNMPQWRNPFFLDAWEMIDLSSNLFEGVIPPEFANTNSLFLNDNRFSNCSNILCPKTESKLVELDLSNNLFSGELPDCWMNFSYLRSLHLENNRFSGRMPKSINTLSRLEYLHLYNNSFSGPFPVAFESLASLKFLNLGYNSFSGNIPSWIGNSSQSLRALILRENHFTGEIPKSMCQLNSSQILDLANNHLSGVIPHCIGNFTALKGIENLQFDSDSDMDMVQFSFFDYGTDTRIESVIVSWKREERRFKGTIRFVKYIDLSSNELSGEIPIEISSLTALGALDLSKNNLSGYIPSEIGNLTSLEFLDLSNNHLSGEIPISLAILTTLDVMNVSNNNLSGEIPVSTQLQSFDASSYAGNPRLCGAPLSSCSKDRAPSNVPNRDITSVQNKDDDFGFFLGLYISVVLGFIVGFWGVCGTLIFKTSWRNAYFRLLDNIKDRIM